MRLAIMQPYLFPYLGYFALAAAVDRFVFLDDVQYIKQGWINRNRWWVDGSPRYFTVPVEGVGAHTPIDGVQAQRSGPWRRKLAATFAQAYARAPALDAAQALLADVLATDGDIGAMAKRSVVSVCDRLGLATEFVPSSRCYENGDLRGEARVLDICRREGATEYVNLPGGATLYDPARFGAIGVRLRFVSAWRRPWPRDGAPEDPTLSVLDALAFHPPAVVRSLIDEEIAA